MIIKKTIEIFLTVGHLLTFYWGERRLPVIKTPRLLAAAHLPYQLHHL